DDLKLIKVYANSHYVTPKPTLQQALKAIKRELKERLGELNGSGRLLEAQRLEQRTIFDMEMMEATGSCAGIENYARYLTGRRPRFLSSCRTTRWCSSTRATSPCRRSAACSAATIDARRRSPSTVSACPPAWITGPCVSRNGTPCDRRRFTCRPRRAPGSWS